MYKDLITIVNLYVKENKIIQIFHVSDHFEECFEIFYLEKEI